MARNRGETECDRVGGRRAFALYCAATRWFMRFKGAAAHGVPLIPGFGLVRRGGEPKPQSAAQDCSTTARARKLKAALSERLGRRTALGDQAAGSRSLVQGRPRSPKGRPGAFPPCSRRSFLLAAGARRMGSHIGDHSRVSAVGRCAGSPRQSGDEDRASRASLPSGGRLNVNTNPKPAWPEIGRY